MAVHLKMVAIVFASKLGTPSCLWSALGTQQIRVSWQEDCTQGVCALHAWNRVGCSSGATIHQQGQVVLQEMCQGICHDCTCGGDTENCVVLTGRVFWRTHTGNGKVHGFWHGGRKEVAKLLRRVTVVITVGHARDCMEKPACHQC